MFFNFIPIVTQKEWPEIRSIYLVSLHASITFVGWGKMRAKIQTALQNESLERVFKQGFAFKFALF